MAFSAISKFAVSKIICIPTIRRPFQKLNDPSYYGMSNAINIRIPIEPGQDIGAWFIRPDSDNLANNSEQRWKSITSCARLSSDNQIEDICQTADLPSLETCDKKDQKVRCEKDNLKATPSLPNDCDMLLTEPNEVVVLYLHGNAETRSHYHRREIYKKWQARGLVVLAVDYRGYADSYGGVSFKTTESSMVCDGVISFRFLKKYIHPETKVIVWGHSLGTGVTTKLAHELRSVDYRPDGIVLEAPFNSMKSEVATFGLAKILKCAIDVDKLLDESDMSFNNELLIESIKEPLFILHAEDDGIIPFELGRQLFKVALDHACIVKFFPLSPKNEGIGHDYIYKHDSFNDILTDIVSLVRKHNKL